MLVFLGVGQSVRAARTEGGAECAEDCAERTGGGVVCARGGAACDEGEWSDSGDKCEDAPDEPITSSPMVAVPRWGYKLEGGRALRHLEHVSDASLYEMQKFASRLVSAGRVLAFVASRIPEHAEGAGRVAAELEEEWAGLELDAECEARGVPLPPERIGRFTVEPPPAAPHATRGAVHTGEAALPVPRRRRIAMLLALYIGRVITGATSQTFGHRDTFGKKIRDCLENKQTIQLRDDDAWVDGPRFEELPLVGPLPPGALGYARTRAATICRAGRDMEFHQLAGAVHMSGSVHVWVQHVGAASPPQPSPTRGVWGADGWFHPWGVALCDWWAEKTRREQRAWLRDRARPVERTSTGLYRYYATAR